MSGTDQGKSSGKSGRRSKKTGRSKKTSSPQRPEESLPAAKLQSPDQGQPLPPPDRIESVPDRVEGLKIASPPTVAEQVDIVPAFSEPPPAALPQAEAPRAEPVQVELTQVSLQIIANAYRDYTTKSLESFGSYFEQLSGARSLDKAMMVQAEFVKKAYETSVAESQRIFELHKTLARQTLQPLQDLVGKGPGTQGKS
jgi:hypothetical protein